MNAAVDTGGENSNIAAWLRLSGGFCANGTICTS